MEIEADDIETNNNNKVNDYKNDLSLYNEIIKDFQEFISLFDNIYLQNLIDFFQIRENSGPWYLIFPTQI